MSCGTLQFDGPAGIAETLRSVDCSTQQATRFAFDRLFGAQGGMSLALTTLLTLYIGLLALNLLTGRSRMRLSLLTPRALTLGLVLTFATSWAAYQQVVWNLAEGAPDQIARLLIGSKGSATDFFAGQLDRMFNTVAEAAVASAPAPDAAQKSVAMSPSDVLWYAGLLLLLGTAGVLLTAKLTLAALLAIGPLFIVLALFDSTRGLFEGWVRSTVLFAVAPLVTVLVGGGALLLMAPMVQALGAAGSTPSMRLAVSLLLAACVYIALVVIAMRAAATLTGAWRLQRRSGERQADPAPTQQVAVPSPLLQTAPIAPWRPDAGREAARDDRLRNLVAASVRATGSGASSAAAAAQIGGSSRARTVVSTFPAAAPVASAGARTRGLGLHRAAAANTTKGHPA